MTFLSIGQMSIKFIFQKLKFKVWTKYSYVMQQKAFFLPNMKTRHKGKKYELTEICEKSFVLCNLVLFVLRGKACQEKQ